jgi:putative ABC transport system permease protein
LVDHDDSDEVRMTDLREPEAAQITRSVDESVDARRAVLARTANPQDPCGVKVNRPSDAVTAQLAAKNTFSRLLIGLGAVSLLVGGVGVTDTMIISVLERRRPRQR